MKTLVLRHGRYDTVSGNLTERWKAEAIEKGRVLIEQIGVNVTTSDILLLGSPVPRAIQTAEAIREWAGLPDLVIHTEHALKDDEITKAVSFINTLPPALFLIIITHEYFVYRLSYRLWNQNIGTGWHPQYLEWPEMFEKDSEPENQIWGTYAIGLQEGVSENDIRKNIRRLEIYSWGTVSIDEISYRYFIPELRFQDALSDDDESELIIYPFDNWEPRNVEVPKNLVSLPVMPTLQALEHILGEVKLTKK